MSFFSEDKLLKLSLALLILTYFVFGWLSAESWQNWLQGVVLTFLIALLLVSPAKLLRISFSSWLGSDLRAFITIIIISFLFVVILTWLHLFARFFVLLASGILVRLELQSMGWSEWHAFGLLAVVCLFSFGLGIVTHQLWLGFILERIFS